MLESFEHRLERAYNTIIESERFKTRVKKAFRGQGKTSRQGIFGIADEFGVDIKTASQYSNVLGGGHYGEEDIEDKVLHRNRAPQAIYKLLKHYGVSPSVAKKLIRFHIDNSKAISKHQVSPKDDIAIDEMHKFERLVAMVSLPIDTLRKMGFVAKQVPWVSELTQHERYKNGIWYIAWPGDEDIIEEISKATGTKRDLLQGLAFGYPMVDIFNYARNSDKQLIDDIVGNVNDL